MKYRRSWISPVARSIVAAALAAGCIDATTIYTLPDLGGPPPSGDDAGDDGAGAVGNEGASGDSIPEAGDR